MPVGASPIGSHPIGAWLDVDEPATNDVGVVIPVNVGLVNLDALNLATSTLSFDVNAVGISLRHPSSVAIPSRAIINRDVHVRDERGVFVEARCEVVLLIGESGAGQRGTVVDTGKPNDRWEFKSQVYNDSHEACWVATRVTQ